MMRASVLAASRASWRAVADDVGHAVEDLGRLVVVREDHGASLLLQPVDLGDDRGEGGPFDLGDDVGDLCVEGLRGLGDFGRVGEVCGPGLRHGCLQ